MISSSSESFKKDCELFFIFLVALKIKHFEYTESKCFHYKNITNCTFQLNLLQGSIIEAQQIALSSISDNLILNPKRHKDPQSIILEPGYPQDDNELLESIKQPLKINLILGMASESQKTCHTTKKQIKITQKQLECSRILHYKANTYRQILARLIVGLECELKEILKS